MRDFAWIVGIENAYIPDMDVDEFDWTNHRSQWREDLRLIPETGATAVRYGITWPEIETAEARFDWSRSDAVVSELDRLGVEPIWDLIHFGTPRYLTSGFLDESYLQSVTRFARAFASRYRGHVRKITPLNEPYISTYFRAGWGIWPPYLKGREGFVRLLRPIVDGLRAAIRAIRDASPDAEIWLNDGADYFHPTEPALAEEAKLRTEERYAAFDILLGLARPGQETYEWLTKFGYAKSALGESSVPIDVIGLDYYPDTEHDLYYESPGGDITQRRAVHPFGVAETARVYYGRYGLPVFIAESSHGGSDADRDEWLAYNEAQIATAINSGVPLVGYTWWPLFDHVDWNSLLQKHEGYKCDSGLYHLRPTKLNREPTPAVATFRSMTQQPVPVPPLGEPDARKSGGPDATQARAL